MTNRKNGKIVVNSWNGIAAQVIVGALVGLSVAAALVVVGLRLVKMAGGM